VAILPSFGWYTLAGFCEIAGCFAFWTWLRSGKSVVWTVPGCLCLVVFAVALTRIGTPFAGRAYAAYGGIYICCSLVWLWFVEGVLPDRWDFAGATLCVVGTALILFAPRGLS